jgi:VCBS repeat-containing protein
MWIRNGNGNDGGGGVLVEGGTLILENVTISGCHAPNEDGGGIKVIDGFAGMTSHAGSLQMTNCTISGNSTAFHAGAIVIDSASSSATITSSTITGNTGGFSNTSGGIRNVGTCTLRNTIVAGNSGTDIPNLDGVFISGGYNVIGTFGTLSPGNPQITATTGDQFNVASPTSTSARSRSTPADHRHTGCKRAASRSIKARASGRRRGGGRGARCAGTGCGANCADVGAYEEQVARSNTPPEAHDDSATIAEDSGANTINVLANDTDANGDTLSITTVTQGAHGAVAFTSTSLSYTPAPNFFGTDTFTYTIDDGHSATDTATVNVTVTNVEDPPDAVDDNATIAEDSGANTVNVLSNDTDVDGDSLTVTSVTQGAHGSVANNGSSVSYTPAHDFFGSDTFTYTISDGHGGSDTATVHMTVTNVNDPPVAAADSYTMNQDTVLTPATGVLGNDTDVDGDVLHALLVSGVAHGILSLNSNGSFTYTPAASFAGTDSFTYKANDGTVDSNVVTVTIHIADTQPPTITAALAIGSLWPPNHDMVNVGLTFSAVDNSTAATTHVAVFSDEPRPRRRRLRERHAASASGAKRQRRRARLPHRDHVRRRVHEHEPSLPDRYRCEEPERGRCRECRRAGERCSRAVHGDGNGSCRIFFSG